MASSSKYVRLSKDAEYTDPVTMNKVDSKEAYYLKPDVSGSKIRHVYHKSTLDRILGSNRKAKSPITRHEFYRTNIRQAPRDGYLHPDLVRKKFQLVFNDRDTWKYTFTAIPPGSRIDYLLNDDNSLTVTKRPGGSSGKRTYQMNINMSLVFSDSKYVERAMSSLVDLVSQSGTMISVDGSRIYKPASSGNRGPNRYA